MWWECPSEVNSTPVPRGSTLLLRTTHISLRTAIPVKAIWSGVDVAPWVPRQWRTLAAGTITWVLKGHKRKSYVHQFHVYEKTIRLLSPTVCFIKFFFVALLMQSTYSWCYLGGEDLLNLSQSVHYCYANDVTYLSSAFGTVAMQAVLTNETARSGRNSPTGKKDDSLSLQSLGSCTQCI